MLGKTGVQITDGVPKGPTFTLRTAASKADVESFAAITSSYYAWLTREGLVPAYQNIEQEIQQLPGPYAAPSGTILIARVQQEDGSSQDVGAIALRPLTSDYIHNADIAIVDWNVKACELKRLYILPAWQQYGLGKQLVEAATDAAQQLRYQRIVLDTLPQMKAANALYNKQGFKLCPSYNGNPMPNVCFWEKLVTTPREPVPQQTTAGSRV